MNKRLPHFFVYALVSQSLDYLFERKEIMKLRIFGTVSLSGMLVQNNITILSIPI